MIICSILGYKPYFPLLFGYGDNNLETKNLSKENIKPQLATQAIEIPLQNNHIGCSANLISYQ